MVIKMNKDVSVIIINYNTFSLVVNCINSIIKYSSGVDYEIIVVDNNSDSELHRKLDNLYQGCVRTIQLNENIGFGRANNEGIKIAEGKYVLCLNPDTLLLNNAIKILYDFMEAHPSAGVCGGNLYDCDMKPTHSYRMMLPSVMWDLDYKLGEIFARLRWGSDREFNYAGKPLKVGYITGADMLMRRDLVNRLGGFSKHFFMYYEECELTYRIKKTGLTVFSVPDAKIQHLEGKSFQSSELTIKEKYLIYSRWMYRRLCSPRFIYQFWALVTRIISCMKCANESEIYKKQVLSEIEKKI